MVPLVHAVRRDAMPALQQAASGSSCGSEPGRTPRETDGDSRRR